MLLAACHAGGGSPDGGSSADAGTDGLSSVIREPARDHAWSGVVVVEVQPAALAWSVDGVPLTAPTPLHPKLVLDTRTLTDGLHRLAITMPADRGYPEETSSANIEIDNGAPSASPFTGTLRDISAAAGLSVVPGRGNMYAPPPAAVAGDFDHDGDLDLFVVPSAQVFLQTAHLVFTPTGSPLSGSFRAAGVGDLDGDGWADIVAVGDHIAILHNVAGTFQDVSAALGLPGPTPAASPNFSGVTLADIDGDGLLDVAVGNLGCSGPPLPSYVLRNEGDLRFVDIAPALGLALPEAATYTFEIERLPDRLLHVWPFNEGCKPTIGKHTRFEDGADLPKLVGATEPFEPLTEMGSAWLDIDGDGLLDQWASGSDYNPLWRAPGFDTVSVAPFAGLDAYPDPAGYPIQTWSMVLFDADLDGKPDVYVAHQPAVDVVNTPGAGDALYWQRAPGKFRELGAVAGLHGDEPCRNAHGADLDGDGDTDLLVGCNDGIRLLENTLVDPKGGRTLVLHGTVSNTDGVHALVTTPSGEQRMMRGGGQPYAGGVVRESVLAPSGSLSVQWPSGIVQTVDAGTRSVLEVTEPKVFTVSPRRVSASAPALVSVEVDPAQLGDAGAEVKIRASNGAAKWATPFAKAADGKWRGQIQVPPSEATVVLEIAVGARVLGIRPRIFVR